MPKGLESYLNKFADEAKTMREVWCLQDSEGLQRDFDRLQLWSDTLLINFNPAKCEVKKVGHSESGPNNDYHPAAGKLRESICERDLGVDIGPNLR